MRRFTSKYHVYENFDVIGIQTRFAASFPNKMLLTNRPAFHTPKKNHTHRKRINSKTHSKVDKFENAT